MPLRTARWLWALLGLLLLFTLAATSFGAMRLPLFQL